MTDAIGFSLEHLDSAGYRADENGFAIDDDGVISGTRQVTSSSTASRASLPSWRNCRK